MYTYALISMCKHAYYKINLHDVSILGKLAYLKFNIKMYKQDKTPPEITSPNILKFSHISFYNL